jgi:hypothetical protein
MIVFARRKADWAGEVLPYVMETLFCVDQHAEASGPGKFKRRRASGRLAAD